MCDKANTPAIRFKDFTDAWEQRKLAEIATMHARIGWQNLRTSEFLDNGDYMLITGTDFEDGVINYSTCHYVDRERYIQDRQIQITNGSILITKDGTLGKVAYVQGLKMPATLNAGVFNVALRDENAVDGKYLFQYLRAPYLMDYVSKKATGGTIKHLNQNILVDFPVVLPIYEEQAKIGEFFFNLDNLITLHQRKLLKLKNIKKAMLEKMFPKNGSNVPEIRFAGFTDAWEQRKLVEIAETRRGLTYNPTNIREAGIRVLRSSNINEDRFVMDLHDVFVEEDAINIPFAKNGDILITSANGSSRLVGKHAIIRGIQEKSTVHGGFMLAASTKFPEFLNASMSSPWYSKFINLYVAGGNGAIGNLNKNDLDEQLISIPTEEEQQQIGTFFQQLDNLITLHQRKYEKLQNLKKACFEKMFV